LKPLGRHCPIGEGEKVDPVRKTALTLKDQTIVGGNLGEIYLDTFSFQTPAFCQRHGYQVFGTLPDFTPGHQRYFFTKQL